MNWYCPDTDKCKVLNLVDFGDIVFSMKTVIFSPSEEKREYQLAEAARTLQQYVAVCCNVLQGVAVRQRSMANSSNLCDVLQCITVCCDMMQCVAVCCSVLQCVAVCCSASALHDSHTCSTCSAQKSEILNSQVYGHCT